MQFGFESALIDLVIEMKMRNPSFGYGRISMQILEAFGIAIRRFAVGRILRNNKHNLPSGNGLCLANSCLGCDGQLIEPAAMRFPPVLVGIKVVDYGISAGF